MARRRASAQITLVLIGAAALSACSSEPETARARDTYLTLEDCAADWGRPEQCERQQITTGAGASTYFHGPVYYAPYRDIAQAEARDEAHRAGFAPAREGVSNRSVGRTSVAPASMGTTARGGFGSSARGFSAGG